MGFDGRAATPVVVVDDTGRFLVRVGFGQRRQNSLVHIEYMAEVLADRAARIGRYASVVLLVGQIKYEAHALFEHFEIAFNNVCVVLIFYMHILVTGVLYNIQQVKPPVLNTAEVAVKRWFKTPVRWYSEPGIARKFDVIHHGNVKNKWLLVQLTTYVTNC